VISFRISFELSFGFGLSILTLKFFSDRSGCGDFCRFFGFTSELVPAKMALLSVLLELASVRLNKS
jgi:hypothetical protein